MEGMMRTLTIALLAATLFWPATVQAGQDYPGGGALGAAHPSAAEVTATDPLSIPAYGPGIGNSSNDVGTRLSRRENAIVRSPGLIPVGLVPSVPASPAQLYPPAIPLTTTTSPIRTATQR
jgi:hypothetical protein